MQIEHVNADWVVTKRSKERLHVYNEQKKGSEKCLLYDKPMAEAFNMQYY